MVMKLVLSKKELEVRGINKVTLDQMIYVYIFGVMLENSVNIYVVSLEPESLAAVTILKEYTAFRRNLAPITYL